MAHTIQASHRSEPVTVPPPRPGDPEFVISLYSTSDEPITEATVHTELFVNLEPYWGLTLAIPLGGGQDATLARVLTEHAALRERYSPGDGEPDGIANPGLSGPGR